MDVWIAALRTSRFLRVAIPVLLTVDMVSSNCRDVCIAAMVGPDKPLSRTGA